MKRYIILDRDGTLIVDRQYLGDPDGVELLPGVVDGLKRLTRLGLGLMVVTNQSGVGRGYFGLEAVHAVNARLRLLLEGQGVTLDDIRVCPHRPDEGCDCRKPRPRLVLAAAEERGFDPSACFVVGDQDCDFELGRNLGAVTIRIDANGPRSEIRADHVAGDLAGAAEIIERLLTACATVPRR